MGFPKLGRVGPGSRVLVPICSIRAWCRKSAHFRSERKEYPATTCSDELQTIAHYIRDRNQEDCDRRIGWLRWRVSRTLVGCRVRFRLKPKPASQAGVPGHKPDTKYARLRPIGLASRGSRLRRV